MFSTFSISETSRNILQSSFYSNFLYSKPILLILDVFESLDVPLSDSVMTETCSRQTTACSRQTCSSSDQFVKFICKYDLICPLLLHSKYITTAITSHYCYNPRCICYNFNLEPKQLSKLFSNIQNHRIPLRIFKNKLK